VTCALRNTSDYARGKYGSERGRPPIPSRRSAPDETGSGRTRSGPRCWLLLTGHGAGIVVAVGLFLAAGALAGRVHLPAPVRDPATGGMLAELVAVRHASQAMADRPGGSTVTSRPARSPG